MIKLAQELNGIAKVVTRCLWRNSSNVREEKNKLKSNKRMIKHKRKNGNWTACEHLVWHFCEHKQRHIIKNKGASIDLTDFIGARVLIFRETLNDSVNTIKLDCVFFCDVNKFLHRFHADEEDSDDDDNVKRILFPLSRLKATAETCRAMKLWKFTVKKILIRLITALWVNLSLSLSLGAVLETFHGGEKSHH